MKTFILSLFFTMPNTQGSVGEYYIQARCDSERCYSGPLFIKAKEPWYTFGTACAEIKIKKLEPQVYLDVKLDCEKIAPETYRVYVYVAIENGGAKKKKPLHGGDH